MAGLRTNALVALGAALFELFAVQLTGVHGVDPTRIAAHVVSGIGFLGAGVILRDGVSVRGINTAATIWCSAAVGVLAGAGYIIQAVIGAVLVVAAHLALRPVARRIDKLPAGAETEVETLYRFRATCRSADEAHIRALAVQALTRDDFVLRAVRSEDLDAGGGLVEVTAELQRYGRDDVALEAAVSRRSASSPASPRSPGTSSRRPCRSLRQKSNRRGRQARRHCEHGPRRRRRSVHAGNAVLGGDRAALRAGGGTTTGGALRLGGGADVRHGGGGAEQDLDVARRRPTRSARR